MKLLKSTNTFLIIPNLKNNNESALRFGNLSKIQRCKKATDFSHHIDKFNVLKKSFLQGNSHDQLLNIITQLHFN